MPSRIGNHAAESRTRIQPVASSATTTSAGGRCPAGCLGSGSTSARSARPLPRPRRPGAPRDAVPGIPSRPGRGPAVDVPLGRDQAIAQKRWVPGQKGDRVGVLVDVVMGIVRVPGQHRADKARSFLGPARIPSAVKRHACRLRALHQRRIVPARPTSGPTRFETSATSSTGQCSSNHSFRAQRRVPDLVQRRSEPRAQRRVECPIAKGAMDGPRA